MTGESARDRYGALVTSDGGATDDATVISTVVEVADALEDLADARHTVDRLLAQVRAGYVKVHQAGVPKTGRRGVAALVRAELESRGWEGDRLNGLGASEQSVRGALDSAR